MNNKLILTRNKFHETSNRKPNKKKSKTHIKKVMFTDCPSNREDISILHKLTCEFNRIPTGISVKTVNDI
jgi:hypothetical protein